MGPIDLYQNLDLIDPNPVKIVKMPIEEYFRYQFQKQLFNCLTQIDRQYLVDLVKTEEQKNDSKEINEMGRYEEGALAIKKWKVAYDRLKPLFPIAELFLWGELLNSDYYARLNKNAPNPHFNYGLLSDSKGRIERDENGKIRKFSGVIERISGGGGTYNVNVHRVSAHTDVKDLYDSAAHLHHHTALPEMTGDELGNQDEYEPLIDRSIEKMFKFLSVVYGIPELYEMGERAEKTSGYLNPSYIV